MYIYIYINITLRVLILILLRMTQFCWKTFFDIKSTYNEPE